MVLVVPFAPGAAGAHTADRAKVVLLVHGYNPLSVSTDCGGEFDPMIRQLRAEGFTEAMVKVGFYSRNRNCDVSLHPYGFYSDRASWKAIAMAFSHYVHRNYTARGITVDIVGYSMGGLIARGAISGAQRGELGFSPPIDVEDAVTLGTPHQGAAWYSRFCLWGQCASLKPGAPDLWWLNRETRPEGLRGTDWTMIASNADWVVPTASATAMTTAHTARVVYTSIPHTGAGNYLRNTTVITRIGVGLSERSR